MGNSIGERGTPVTNSYQRPGIQSKRQLNSVGNMLSKMSVDGGDIFATQHGGIEIRVPNPVTVQEMYRVVQATTPLPQEVRVYNGVWIREGKINGTDMANDTTFDPLAEAGSESTYSGMIYACALIENSDGTAGGTGISDFDPKEGDYGSGTTTVSYSNGVGVFFIDEKPQGGAGLSVLPLAELTYESGRITKITQLWQGMYADDDPLNPGDTIGTESIHYNIQQLTLDTFEFQIKDAKWWHNYSGKIKELDLAAAKTYDQTDIDGADDIFATILDDPANLVAGQPDPGLGEFELSIQQEGSADDWRDEYDDKAMRILFQKIVEVGGTTDYGSATVVKLPNMKVLRWQPFYTTYFRPDGTDTSITALDDDTPRLKGLDYSTDTATAGEGTLQDYQAYEKIITATDVGNNTGDKILQYYDYTAAGVTDKEYCRIDSDNASTWQVGESLEISTKSLHLYDWITRTPVTFSDAVTQSGTDQGEYLILAQEQGANYDTLRYLNLSTMNVATCDLADEATTLVEGTEFAHTDLFDMADATGANQDHDFAYLRNYTTSADAAYVNNAEYRNRGPFYSARLGLANAGTGAPDTSNNWDLDGFKYKMTNGAEFAADTNHDFLVGLVRISNTSAAGSGVGSLLNSGGYCGAEGLYVLKGGSNQAGYFSGSGKVVKLASGNDAIEADGGNISLTNGVFEHASNAGRSITNWFSGGAFCGGSVIEIDQSDLQAGDKLLVIR